MRRAGLGSWSVSMASLSGDSSPGRPGRSPAGSVKIGSGAVAIGHLGAVPHREAFKVRVAAEGLEVGVGGELVVADTAIEGPAEQVEGLAERLRSAELAGRERGDARGGVQGLAGTRL